MGTGRRPDQSGTQELECESESESESGDWSSDAVIESAGVVSESESGGERYTHGATVSGDDSKGDDLVSGNDSGVQSGLHRGEKTDRRRDNHCHHSAASTSANDDHGHDLGPVRWEL